MKSKCTQESQTALSPDKAKKTQSLVHQLKYKFEPSPRLHSEADHIINAHTKQMKCLGMDSTIPIPSTGQNDLKISTLGYVGFQDKFDTPPLKPTKTEPSFRKVNSPHIKLCMHFPTHLYARVVCPQTYSLSLPIEWSQSYTHSH